MGRCYVFVGRGRLERLEEAGYVFKGKSGNVVSCSELFGCIDGRPMVRYLTQLCFASAIKLGEFVFDE
jgi:hypothetical protein